LITNDRQLSAEALLLAYKGQPVIEKRFEQLKTEFEVAPVFLKEVSRIQALLCLYFFVLLVQALLERELRRAMARHQIESLPLYPEGRACRRPTTPQLIELFENVQRHCLVVQRKELSSIPQPLFPGLGVAGGGDPVSPLAPCGQLDRLALGPLWRRGSEDDLQQSPDIRQRQAVLGFFPPAAAPAGPGTTSPT
jgi:hypothetical protein